MNFKTVLFLFSVPLLLSGCGVKARPALPPEKAISSYVESYTNTTYEDPQKKEKKK